MLDNNLEKFFPPAPESSTPSNQDPIVQTADGVGGELPPGDDSVVPDEKHPSLWERMREKIRQGRCDSFFGWALSLLLHAGLLIGFAGFHWSLKGLPGSPSSGVGIVAEGEGLELDTGESEAAVLQFDQSELLVAPLGAELFEMSEFRPESPEVPLTESALEVDALTLIAGAAGSRSDAMKTQDNVFPGGGGALQGGTASFFGLEAHGTKFVYVVDYSGSMTGPKLHAAKAELIRSLQGLNSKVEFFIIFYDNHFVPMPEGKLIRATEANKQKAIAWVQQIFGGGGTDPTWAMDLALSLKPDAVWLLSDGKFALRACEVIREANATSRVQIHTIAFHDNIGERQLRLIAQENGGRFRFVPGPTRRYGPHRRR